MKYRPIFDELLKKLMIYDGACRLRASYYKFAVKNFGKGSAEPKNQRKILYAPHTQQDVSP